MNDEELHEEILLQLYIDRKKEIEDKENFILGMRTSLKCHSCGRRITKDAKFICFHDVHEAINYVKNYLLWKEDRGSRASSRVFM